MERKMKRQHADRVFSKPDGIDAKLAHARRCSTRRRREKAEKAFLRSLSAAY